MISSLFLSEFAEFKISHVTINKYKILIPSAFVDKYVTDKYILCMKCLQCENN